MSKRFRLDFSTAYGQLILLVFLPISALALTGGFLVLSDTSRAARTIQKSTADSLLVTFQPVAAAMQTSLLKIDQGLRGHSKMSARAIAEKAGNSVVMLELAEAQRWRRTAASVEADWVNDVKAKGIDGTKLAADARARMDKYAK